MLPNIKNILFLDAETYYDDEYSLRKMPTPSYILDERFELQMMATAVGTGECVIVDGPDFPEWLTQFDPAVTATVTFNALFDNSILAWLYGWVPALMFDSMAMARALRGHVLHRSNLETVAEVLELGAKGHALAKVKGLRRQDIMARGLWPEFSTYALQDNLLNRGIFTKLIRELPKSEWRLMDMVLRCTIQPTFVTDTDLLTQHLRDLRVAKLDLLWKVAEGKTANNADGKMIYDVTRRALLGGHPQAMALLGKCHDIFDRSAVSSPTKFRKALEDLGVTVETKISPATGKEVPAFAKTDSFMETLQEHQDTRVQALAAARLGIKSTLEETRSEKLLGIARLPWGYRGGNPRLYSGGTMPIPLAYGKTHTHRLAGEWKMNMQNLPRGSKLRRALIAPPGHTVITADLAQIEARLVAWYAGCNKLLDEFRSGDPYSAFGTMVFGTPVNRKAKLSDGKPDPQQFAMGFIGKTGVLGLGYGAGKDKFDTMVIKTARLFGIDLSVVNYTRQLGDAAVETYRSQFWEIPALWRRLDQVIQTMWTVPNMAPLDIGPLTYSPGQIMGPNYLSLQYVMLPWQPGEDFRYQYGRETHKIYGAKVLENVIQFLARIIVMNAALRIFDRTGFRFVLQAHDELVYVVPDNVVDTTRKIIHEEMTRSPSWAPNFPLAAETGVGRSYGEAK